MTLKHSPELSTQKKTPNKVYLVPASVQYAENREVFAMETILTHPRYHLLNDFKKHGVIGVKSCETVPTHVFLYANAVVRLLTKQDHAGFLCGTSNRHLDHTSHGMVCASKVLAGFASLDEAVPFMPLDGLFGEHEISRKHHRKLDAQVFLAGELPNLDGLVSVCCITPSDDAFVYGSIVNLGQGLASKKGKIHQRTTTCPQNHIDNCYACRRCVRACPSHAISIVDGHVSIDEHKCIKCGKCVEIAHYGGITYNWNASLEHYCQAVARHAKGVQTVMDNQVICVNILLQDSDQGKTFAGAMISLDPVALDNATLEFCTTHHLIPEASLSKLQSLIETAQTEGVGSTEYQVETVAY